MPIPLLAHIFFEGIPDPVIPYIWPATKLLLALTTLTLIKWYTRGATNTSERTMHSKVVLITGGTTGIGAETAFELANRGAQVILLTHDSPSDPFLIDYIEDLRARTNNELIYAEQVDLTSLHSIRKFATKWIDNAPPRRLDMLILCAATLTPPGKPRRVTSEGGIEETWMVNYLANFHLLSILSPALRAQPPDRDVRILIAACSTYISSPPIISGDEALDPTTWSAGTAYARSKLAMLVFGQAFQKHLDAYKRPDNFPCNARVVFVDPGYSRTPGMRRWLTRGSLWGLGVYLLCWQVVWLVLKSAGQGAQSLLFAAMEERIGRGGGGRLVKECIEVDFARRDVKDEEIAKRLWEGSEKVIERVEREEAVRRAVAKKERESVEGQKGVQKGEEKKDGASSGPEGKKASSRRGKKGGK